MGKFNNFPKEIMSEILTRLPTESVLDCKLVCKAWRDVVHHSSFSEFHLSHLNRDDSGKLSFIFLSCEYKPEGIYEEFYYAEYDENCDEVPFIRKTRINLSPLFINKQNYTLGGSCNGLICLNSFSKGVYGPSFICNPIMREYVILPKFERQYWWTGFGCSPLTNEYKVVRIYGSGGDSNVGIIQVYTLGSGSGWRNAGTMDFNMNNVNTSDGVFANGVLHWVDRQGTIILAFHLADEKFSKFSPPPCLAQSGVPYLVVTLRLLGVFVSASCYYKSGGCDIWLLNKNKDNNDLSWSREFILDSNIQEPLDFTKCGRLLCYEGSTIYSYDKKTSSAKTDVSFCKSISETVRHKNTLVSLNALGERDTKTMEYGERASSSEDRKHDKLKNPQNGEISREGATSIEGQRTVITCRSRKRRRQNNVRYH